MNLWSFDKHSSVQLNLFERYIVTGPTFMYIRKSKYVFVYLTAFYHFEQSYLRYTYHRQTRVTRSFIIYFT